MKQSHIVGRGDAFNSYFAKAKTVIEQGDGYSYLKFYRQMLAITPQGGSSLWSWIRWAFGAEPKMEGYTPTPLQASEEKDSRQARRGVTIIFGFTFVLLEALIIAMSVMGSPFYLFAAFMPLALEAVHVGYMKMKRQQVLDAAAQSERLYGTPEAVVIMYMDMTVRERCCDDQLKPIVLPESFIASSKTRNEITGEAADAYRKLLKENNDEVMMVVSMLDTAVTALRSKSFRPSCPSINDRDLSMAIVTSEPCLEATLKYEGFCRRLALLITLAQQGLDGPTPCASLRKLANSGEFIGFRYELTHFSLPPLPIK